MTKTHLLKVASAVAMLAASPVLAQTNMPTGDTGAGGVPNTPTTHETMPSTGATAAAKPPSTHPMHGMAMKHHSVTPAHAMKGDSSQDSVVDSLNEQSFQAAQQGQAFTASGPTGGAPSTPTAPAAKKM